MAMAAVREFEEGFILTVLQEQEGNQVRDAQDLGIHRNTLRRMIHSLQINIQPIGTAAPSTTAARVLTP